ncbi:phage tail assembly chaperone [Brevundimonas nasdae]|uniref:phage tail assembly chaperone n=1 Tax=Brevundimonas nasdae TaxID=172043 RepID=UPI00289C3513|nr:phage tail assembly chaperone [Brevundimonas nasdae]
MTLQAVTPWGAMLRIAAQIGVTPDAFWRLSLKEWRMLNEAPGGTTPMGRQALKQLMEDWPDGG